MSQRNETLFDTLVPDEYAHWLSRESVWGWLFLVPTIVALGLVALYPIARGVWLSFYEYDGVGDPEWVGLNNYVEALTWPEFWIVLRNMFVWSFAAVVLMMVIGLGFAILLNREFRGRSIATTLLLLPWAIPFIAIALNWRLLYSYELGAFNGMLRLLGLSDGIAWIGSSRYALFSITLTWVWRNFPFFMICFLAAMRGIPSDLYEAAQVDGSTRLDLFRHITIPFIQPITIVLTLLMSVWTLNHFTLVFVMTGGGPGLSSMVLPVYIYQLAFELNQIGFASAIAVITLVLSMVYGLIYLRLYDENVGGK